MLLGSEVKALRAGSASLDRAYALARPGGLYLINAFIGPYQASGRFSHSPRRARKLLLHKRQISRFADVRSRAGMTLVPLRLYFDAKGRAKVEIALVRGRKTHDRRAREKERDWQRRKGALLRRKVRRS